MPHRRVQPRMTRDFLVEFDSSEQATQAAATLRSARAANGMPLFDEVDNRGDSLFVTLTYPHDIPEGFDITVDGTTYHNFDQDVVLVAIKNAHHDTLGYFMDTASTPDQAQENLPLKALHGRVLDHFGL